MFEILKIYFIFFCKGGSICGNNNGLRLNIQSGHIKTPGLVNYWSFNSHIKDVIGGLHLFNGNKAGLTNDIFDACIEFK